MKSIKQIALLFTILMMTFACTKPENGNQDGNQDQNQDQNPDEGKDPDEGKNPDEGDGPEEVKLPEMTALFESPVSIDSEKQELTLEFRIDNPVEGAKMKAKAQCDWMRLEVKGSSVIESQRLLDSRNTEIDVTYQYGKESTEILETTIPFSQAVMEGIQDVSFQIEFLESAPHSISAAVTPSDNEIFYVCMAADKAGYDSFGSDEAWVNAEIGFFKMSADASGLTVLDILDSVGGKGYQEITIQVPSGCYPAYYYVYGLTYEENPKLITKVYKEMFMVTE